MFEFESFLKLPSLSLGMLFAGEISRIIRLGDTRSKEIDVLVMRLFKQYGEGGMTFSEAIKLTMRVAMAIDTIKIQKLGFKYSTAVSNAIINCFFCEMARNMQVSNADVENLSALSACLNPEGGTYGWFVPKLQILEKLLIAKMNSASWAKDFRLPGAEENMEKLNSKIPSLNREISGIMEGITELRKYGVKTCYFQDGISHESGDAWYFADPTYLVDEASAKMSHIPLAENFLAFIMMGKKPKPGAALNVEREFIHNEVWDMHQITLPINGKFSWVMDRKGELWLWNNYSVSAVRDFFVAAGKELEYELLRMAHAIRLYDLVVPMSVVSQLPVQPIQSTGLAKILSPLARKPLLTHELIIPRIRKLDSYMEIMRAMNQEMDQSEEKTKRRATRQHEVEYFVRPLPKGHKPSEEAKRRALKVGIILSDDETFVKKHNRGSGEKVPTPKARQRSR
jgi:hypothetical protein